MRKGLLKKNEIAMKRLFEKYFISFVAFCYLSVIFMSCSNESDILNSTYTKSKNNNGLVAFIAGEPDTRTSINYNTGDFYWEEGDKIYVKDDDNIWRESSNSVDASHAHSASFYFMVPGKFTNSSSYKVYYSGKNGLNDQVTIPASQSQTSPNNTVHLGNSGDCGIANATKASDGKSFNFRLDHQAAILVFQPYTSNKVLRNCYLTKIELISDNEITGTFVLDSNSGSLTGSGNGKQIILTTQGSNNYANGFPLNTNPADISANNAYMIIKPGTHTFKVRYWVKDLITNVEGTITKALGTFTYNKNVFYDLKSNLDTRDYSGADYYMWDARQNYWAGYEWNSGTPLQPTLNRGSNSNYPKSNTDPRFSRESYKDGNYNAIYSCSIAPNANEMLWYIEKGEPRFDKEEVWTTMGHLYKGGLWIKKRQYIPNFSSVHIPGNNSIDLRTTSTNLPLNRPLPSPILPTASESSQFFYLPLRGLYTVGWATSIGDQGRYWTSTADVGQPGLAYTLTITSPNGALLFARTGILNGQIVKQFE